MNFKGLYKRLFKVFVFVGLIFGLALSLVYPLQVIASDDVWQAVRDGKAVVIMRHAIAPSGVDNSALTRESCQGQRNLSQQGRDQAKQLGDIFRANGIDDAMVLSSSLCRSFDTALLLGFNAPILLPEIDAFQPNPRSSPEQTAELKQWIMKEISELKKPTILVTHGFNITELMGELVQQGEFLIIGSDGEDIATLLRVSP